MATFTKLHDLTTFTDKEGVRDSALKAARFDAEGQRLIATDGKMLVTVPVSGNGVATTPLTVELLKKFGKAKGPCELSEKKGKLAVKIDGKEEAVEIPEDLKTRNYPNVDKVTTPGKPVRVVSLAVANLKRLVDYASKNDAEALFLAIYEPGKENPAEVVRFLFRSGSALEDSQPADQVCVTGAIAGMNFEEKTVMNAFVTAAKGVKAKPHGKAEAAKPTAEPTAKGKGKAKTIEEKTPAAAPKAKAAKPAAEAKPTKPAAPAKPVGKLPRPTDAWPEAVTEHFTKAEQFLIDMRPALARRQLNLAKELAEGSLAAGDKTRKEIEAALPTLYAKVDEVHAAKKGDK